MNYSALIESLECAVIVIDHEQSVVLANISAESLFCQSRRYLKGKDLCDLVDDSTVLKCIDDCLLSNAQYTLREISVFVNGKELLVDITVS